MIKTFTGSFDSKLGHYRAIQQRMGLDGKPPVQEIFDLAQVRAKGTSMDEIVLNARVILEALTPAAATAP